MQASKNITICGDFNIDMNSITPHSRRLKNICEDYGLDILVDRPTRVTIDSATIIDLCMTNINRNKITCNVLSDDQISDHSIIEMIIYGETEKKVTKQRKIKVWQNYNVEDLWVSLESKIEPFHLINSSGINIKTQWILKQLHESTEQFMRIKTVKTKTEFFDTELELMRREKNRLYKIAQYTNNPVESCVRWHEYRRFKNDFKNAIQSKKFVQNQRRLDRVRGNTKATWQVLNSILNKENSEVISIKCGDIEIEDDLTLANEFNKYFIDSIVELNKSIPLHHYEEEEIVNHQNLSFEFRAVTISEIKTCLKELKNNTDEYFLNAAVLLDAMFIIGRQLTSIINESFGTAIFPDTLKKSISGFDSY